MGTHLFHCGFTLLFKMKMNEKEKEKTNAFLKVRKRKGRKGRWWEGRKQRTGGFSASQGA